MMEIETSLVTAESFTDKLSYANLGPDRETHNFDAFPDFPSIILMITSLALVDYVLLSE